MFHAWEVKIAKMAAHSGPSKLPGNKPIKTATVTDKKPRIGTDCKTSIIGMMRRPARRLLAAQVPKIKVKRREKNKAISMRTTVRAAYKGKSLGFKERGITSPS